MSRTAHLLRGVCGVAIAATRFAIGGMRGQAQQLGAVPAAKVSAIAHEDELNTVELSPDAEKRLGVTTTLLEWQAAARAAVRR